MAKDKRRMMMNRAKKKAREAARKNRRKRAQAHSGGRFAPFDCTRAEMEQAPVHAALVARSIFETGIGHVIVARKLPNESIASGFFLIDAYCLGVKDAFPTITSPLEFDEMIETKLTDQDMQSVSPGHARKLVEDAIAYALDLGLEPHPDFRDAEPMLTGIDASECKETFTFGKDGKPLYIAGAYDSEVMIRRVTAKLKERFGPDGVRYVMRVNINDDDDENGGDRIEKLLQPERNRKGEPETDPDLAEAADKALCLADDGFADEALEDMARLQDRVLESHLACYAMGVAHSLNHESHEAVSWYDKAIALFPGFVEAHFNKATEHLLLRELADAIRAYRHVVEFGKPDEEAVHIAKNKLHGIDNALRVEENLDTDQFLKTEDHFNLAIELMEREKWTEALDALRACLALNERNPPTHGALARCYAQLGRKADALAALDRALEIKPDYHPAAFNRKTVEAMTEGRPLNPLKNVDIEFGNEPQETRSSFKNFVKRMGNLAREKK